MVEIQREVAHSEVDADLKARYASILTYMQDCSFVHLLSQDMLLPHMEEHGVGMFLTNRQFNLYKIPVFRQKLVIRTWVYELNRFLGYRNTLVYDRDTMEVLAASYAGGAFVNMHTGLPTQMPEEPIKKVLIEDKFDGMKYLPRKVRIPDIPGEEKAPIPVYRSYTDSYRHTNNAQYIRMIMDCLDEEYYPEVLRAEYRVPSREGDVLYPTIYRCDENKINAVMRNQKGEVCVSCEMLLKA